MNQGVGRGGRTAVITRKSPLDLENFTTLLSLGSQSPNGAEYLKHLAHLIACSGVLMLKVRSLVGWQCWCRWWRRLGKFRSLRICPQNAEKNFTAAFNSNNGDGLIGTRQANLDDGFVSDTFSGVVPTGMKICKFSRSAQKERYLNQNFYV